MKKLAIGLLIGTIAGLIDVAPMTFMELGWHANTSAFLHWLILGIIIPFVSWDLYGWIKGAIIGLISAAPIILLTLEKDSSSVLPIIGSSIVLGALVGLAGQRFITDRR